MIFTVELPKKYYGNLMNLNKKCNFFTNTKNESPEPTHYSVAWRTFATIIIAQTLNNYNNFLALCDYDKIFNAFGGQCRMSL